MKKLTTLICLMLCVIVGAVYANWNYASFLASDASGAVTVALAVKEDTESGTITVTGAPAFEIDQATESYTAELVWSEKNLTISFAASDIAPADVKDGVTLEVKFTVSSALDEAINATDFEVALNAENGWTTTVDMSTKIVVDGSFTLSTPDAYEAFEAAEKTISMTISQKQGS